MTTPGPWIIDGDVPDKLGFQGWLCTPTGPLGRMEPVCHIEAVSAADVRLIAAAPDLLRASRNTLAYYAATQPGRVCLIDQLNPCGGLNHWGWGDGCPLCSSRAALAKASL